MKIGENWGKLLKKRESLDFEQPLKQGETPRDAAGPLCIHYGLKGLNVPDSNR